MERHELIERRGEAGVAAFTGGIVAAVLLLSVAWGEAANPFLQFKTPFAFTATEYNQAEIARSVRTPSPDIAIVGSSLGRRLDPGLFGGVRTINLSTDGGSVMTGLEILNSAPSLPRIILIEINILDRPVDKELNANGEQLAQSQPRAILMGAAKPLRYLLTQPVFSYAPPEHQAAWWMRRRARLRSQPPASYDIESQVAAGRAHWSSRDHWEVAQRNVNRIRELADQLKARGAKVYMLYLPYSAGYDEHPYARRNRELAGGSDAFDCRSCIDVRRLVPVEELRWADGAHLDERSALMVADALQKRLQGDIRY